MSGLATAIAVLLAGILSPFVLLYDKLTGKEATYQAEIERRHALFNPLYDSMIEVLEKRNPIDDAKIVFKGEVLFIPSTKEGGIYPGFGITTPPITDVRENNARLERNAYIQTYASHLYGVDEEALGEAIFLHHEYQEVVMTYKEHFNLTMDRLRKGEDPNAFDAFK